MSSRATLPVFPTKLHPYLCLPFLSVDIAVTMEVGASIVAFVTLAAQSTKIICGLLSDIKDAPDQVNRAVASACALEQALEQMLQCSYGSEQPWTAGFRAAVEACYKDLDSIESSLKKIQVLTSDSRGVKARKHVRAILRTDECDKVANIVAAHASVLNLWLQIIRRYCNLFFV